MSDHEPTYGGELPPEPLLHGLTLDQLEAVRGYCETVAAVGQMAAGLVSGDMSRREAVENLSTMREEKTNVGDNAYADGIRFALAHGPGAAMLAWVEQMVSGAAPSMPPAQETSQ